MDRSSTDEWLKQQHRAVGGPIEHSPNLAKICQSLRTRRGVFGINWDIRLPIDRANSTFADPREPSQTSSSISSSRSKPISVAPE